MSSPSKQKQERLEHVLKMLDNSGITPADLLRYANGGDIVGHCKNHVRMRAEKLRERPRRCQNAGSVVKANQHARIEAKKTQKKVAQNLAYQAKIYENVLKGSPRSGSAHSSSRRVVSENRTLLPARTDKKWEDYQNEISRKERELEQLKQEFTIKKDN